MANLKLTTVKVIQKLYDEDFKIAAIHGGINFQKLVNRTLDLYTRDEKFRKNIAIITFGLSFFNCFRNT